MNSSYVSKSKLNISSEGNNNDRMVKLADKLSQITNQIQNEKSSKFDQYEQKSMNLYDTIEANKEQNNAKFNEVKEQILVIQKTLEDDAAKGNKPIMILWILCKKWKIKFLKSSIQSYPPKKKLKLKSHNI